MKSLVKYGKENDSIELREVSKPSIRADEVMLAIRAVGICGTDLHIIAGEYPCKPPVTLGHEFVGQIVEVGKSVTDFQVGDRVASLPYAQYCGVCRHCQAGEIGLCEQRISYGSGINGGFADYLAVRASGLYLLPDNQDYIAGSLTEPLACVTKAVFSISSVSRNPNHHVVVIGPGQIGLLTVQVVRALGIEVSLIGLSQDEARLQLGREFGANHVFYADHPDMMKQIEAKIGPDRINSVFECSGAESAFTTALTIVRRQGEVIQVGLFGKQIRSNLDLVVFKDLTVVGTFASSRASWKKALELTASSQVNTSLLVSDVYPLEEWESAFKAASDKSGLKVVIQPLANT